MASSLPSTLLHVAGKKGYTLSFVVAGGGISLFDLFKIEGCSRVLIEANVLYSEASLERFLGRSINEPFVSRNVAEQLACAMSIKSEANLCFALTCALKTDRERKGKNHGYLSISRKGQADAERYFEIEGTSRLDQDRFITDAVLRFLIEYLEQKNEIIG